MDIRRPLTVASFSCDFLLPLVFHYTTAVLALYPGTLLYRLALLPLTLLFTLRGATLDYAGREGYGHVNQVFMFPLIAFAMRSIVWTFRSNPLTRIQTHNGEAQPASNGHATTLDVKQTSTIMDAFDLFFNLQGVGWDWSMGYRPPRKRPTLSKWAFVRTTLKSVVLGILTIDALFYYVQSLSPSTIGSPKGDSIFDPNLPPLQRYSRSTIITVVGAIFCYCSLEFDRNIAALVGVLVFGQDPSLWPPIFDRPWLSTSVSEFWGRRWHQVYRPSFVFIGGKPMSLIAGRAGRVMGPFLLSGLLHAITMWALGNSIDFWDATKGFLLNGMLVLLEFYWSKATKSRVGGRVGWIWTMVCLVVSGQLIIDSWAKRGWFGGYLMPWSLARLIFGELPRN